MDQPPRAAPVPYPAGPAPIYPPKPIVKDGFGKRLCRPGANGTCWLEFDFDLAHIGDCRVCSIEWTIGQGGCRPYRLVQMPTIDPAAICFDTGSLNLLPGGSLTYPNICAPHNSRGDRSFPYSSELTVPARVNGRSSSSVRPLPTRWICLCGTHCRHWESSSCRSRPA